MKVNKKWQARFYDLQWRWQWHFGKAEGHVSYETDKQKCSDMIYDLLSKDEPCMIARFGNTEFQCVLSYLGVRSGILRIWNYLSGKAYPFWWLEEWCEMLKINAGFFPNTKKNISKFSKLQLRDMREVDILGSWIPQEWMVQKYIKQAQKIALNWLEPFHVENPWTRALEGKKVLVVHPFADLIKKQYDERRSKLFSNPDVLPKFNLLAIKAVQSLGGGKCGFSDWFEALEYMKKEIDSVDYDICIIGCGAYGFSLAAHVKRFGKKAIHLGGVTQMLFGIKGSRWEDPNYATGVKEIPYGFYRDLMNEYWVRPGEDLKPEAAEQVEGACYW